MILRKIKNRILTFGGAVIWGIGAVVLGIGLWNLNNAVCFAAEGSSQARMTHEDTGYRVIIEDDAELLTEDEERQLVKTMAEITPYGNVAFKSITVNNMGSGAAGTESYARDFYREQFGTDSGTLFLIDMENRKLWIHSDGAVYKVITTAYANTITDNVYRMASNEEYFDCANEVFTQITTLLQGNKIAQPMKYINNALLAVIAALLLNFLFVSNFAKLRKPTEKQMMRQIKKHFTYTKPQVTFTHKSKVYSPIESDSGSGSGYSGGSSSGGGGGSSSSGGGGGHSF